MGSPVAHLIAATAAYYGTTAPKSTAPVRGAAAVATVMVLGLLPDAMQIFAQTGSTLFRSGQRWDVVAAMHGLAFGVIIAAALAGAIPTFRQKFWVSFGVLFIAGHGSHVAVDWLSLHGVSIWAPFDWRRVSVGLAILPTADARILSISFMSAVKTMAVEAGILFPFLWSALMFGREGGESRSKGWMAGYALSWPAAAALAFWSVQRKGSF